MALLECLDYKYMLVVLPDLRIQEEQFEDVKDVEDATGPQQCANQSERILLTCCTDGNPMSPVAVLL